jgi:hypothetical protein
VVGDRVESQKLKKQSFRIPRKILRFESRNYTNQSTGSIVGKGEEKNVYCMTPPDF